MSSGPPHVGGSPWPSAFVVMQARLFFRGDQAWVSLAQFLPINQQRLQGALYPKCIACHPWFGSRVVGWMFRA